MKDNKTIYIDIMRNGVFQWQCKGVFTGTPTKEQMLAYVLNKKPYLNGKDIDVAIGERII